MSAEKRAQKRARFIQQAALRAARKKLKRNGGVPLTRAELLNLRIQRAPTWLRLLMAFLGTAIAVGGLFALVGEKSEILSALLLPLGIGLFALALRGWQERLEQSLSSLGTSYGANPVDIIELLIKALD
jgi:hypothetical protein